MSKIILTGDRPTGRLHLGHYVGSLKRRVELQNSGEFDKIFIMIADAQALTDNADNPEKVGDSLKEIKNASEQLEALVNDVLDISAIESGKLLLRLEDVNIPDIFRRI